MRWQFILATACLLFTLGCQPPGPRALLDGEKLIREGNYPLAIQKLEVATKALPGHPQAWNYLGLAYQYGGKPAEALRAYTQAVSLDRNLAAIRFNLGNLHLEQGRLNEAILELTTATVLDPNSVETWVQLGKAQLRAKRVDEAERTFVNALRVDQNNVEALNYQGVVQMHRRRATDAKAYFAAALRLQANYAPAVLNQAMLFHYYLVNKTNALAKYREYLAMKPDAAGAAAAGEAVRVLEAELQPRPVLTAVTNAPVIHTNRTAIAPVTNVITHRLVAVTPTPTNAFTNRIISAAPAHTNIVVTNRIVAVAPTNPPPVVRVEPRTNVVITPAAPKVTNTPIAPKITNVAEAPVTNKPVLVAALPKPEPKVTNTPPPAVVTPTPAPKTNVVVAPFVTVPATVVTFPAETTPAPPAIKVETPKPLEVVTVDDDSKFVTAKDIAEPKAQTPLPPKKTVEIAAKPVETAPIASQPSIPAPAAPTNKVEEVKPLIRPVRAEEKSSWLKKANPMSWLKRDKAESEEKVVAKKASPQADLKTLPDDVRPGNAIQTFSPEPEVKPLPKPEPIIPRYPYRADALPAAGNRAAAEKPFHEAFDAHQEGKLGKAMDGFREAIRLDPRFFEANLNLGIAAAQAGDFSLALASLEDSVRLNPKSVEARYQFAVILRRANYPQDAVNELKAVLDEAPKEARAHLAIANLYAQVFNKPDLASEHYQKVLQLEPRHPQGEQIRAWLAQH